MDGNLRHFVDAQHAIVPEVGLLDAAILDGDLTMKCAGQPEHDAALHLRANRIGVHLDAAVDDAPDVGRLDCPFLVHGDLDDLRDEAPEARRTDAKNVVDVCPGLAHPHARRLWEYAGAGCARAEAPSRYNKAMVRRLCTMGALG